MKRIHLFESQYRILENATKMKRRNKRFHLTEGQFHLITEALLLEMSLQDIYAKYYSSIPQETFSRLISADPTSKPNKMGKYSKWLLSLYQRGKMKIGDLGEAKTCLDYFSKYINRIEVKDINKYASIKELYDVVEPFMENPNQATSKSDELRRQKEQDATIVYEDEIWKVVVPHTEEMACLYGKGTRWCTAAEESDNMFRYYHNQGELYININKQNNRKYQFNFETESFMDEQDETIMRPIPITMNMTKGLIAYYKQERDLSDFLKLYYEDVEDESEGFVRVFGDNGVEWIGQDGKALANSYFYEDGGSFNNGYAWVCCPASEREAYDDEDVDGGEYNFINKKGLLLSDTWFDDVTNFESNFARVELDGKANLIGTDGGFLFDDWNRYAILTFTIGQMWVIRDLHNSLYNFINADGKMVSKLWFTEVDRPLGTDVYKYAYGHLIDKDDDGHRYFRWFKIYSNGEVIEKTGGINQIVQDVTESINGGFINEESLLTEATLQDIYAKYYSNMPQEEFEQIVNADPTARPNKMGKYGKWLLSLYQRHQLLIEDLYKAKEYLEFFNKYINRIEVKDINKYKSLSDLYRVVQPFMKDPSQATSHSDEVRKIKEGAEKVYEDGKWLIIIPHTKEASCYYGKGTQWCTAATSSNNMFDYYDGRGDLYILIDKEANEKYQFHFESDSFMDEIDEPIEGVICQTVGLTDGAMQYFKNVRSEEDFDKLITKTYDFYSSGNIDDEPTMRLRQKLDDEYGILFDEEDGAIAFGVVIPSDLSAIYENYYENSFAIFGNDNGCETLVVYNSEYGTLQLISQRVVDYDYLYNDYSDSDEYGKYLAITQEDGVNALVSIHNAEPIYRTEEYVYGYEFVSYDVVIAKKGNDLVDFVQLHDGAVIEDMRLKDGNVVYDDDKYGMYAYEPKGGLMFVDFEKFDYNLVDEEGVH